MDGSLPSGFTSSNYLKSDNVLLYKADAKTVNTFATKPITSLYDIFMRATDLKDFNELVFDNAWTVLYWYDLIGLFDALVKNNGVLPVDWN